MAAGATTASIEQTPSVIIGCCNLIELEGAYLFVREGKPSARARFNLPAGKPEVGETLPEAAVREAKEESGLDVAIDHIVGLYHCPQTSEGFGVVNFVFASTVLGGQLATSDAHPEVRFFTRAEITALAGRRLLRGSHIERAIDDHARGQQLPLDLLCVVPASALPTP
jgi:ADP-ribose pyrophosphatase YjhB (NUDIX family)